MAVTYQRYDLLHPATISEHRQCYSICKCGWFDFIILKNKKSV